VSYNGFGIDREIQSSIFETFFTTRVKGTGLGLAAVAEVMASAKGAVRVESTPGLGTAFHLYFPADLAEWDEAVESSHSNDAIDRV
jgi:nitrogen-specific signal transduction histidine kinase